MRINVFMPYAGGDHSISFIDQLQRSELINEIFFLTTDDDIDPVKNCKKIKIEGFTGSKTIKTISDNSDCDYSLIITQDAQIDLGQFCIERFVYVAEATGAGMVYSNYNEIKGDVTYPHPVIDYQLGSLRDDFNFGYMLLYNSAALKEASSQLDTKYKFAGLYGLRLTVSEKHPIIRIPEYLYSTIEKDIRKSGEKQFDYVDPKNREVQIEMEKAVTEHLKQIGAYLEPEFDDVDFSNDDFKFEASVIIPVKNRAKTLKAAIESVLKQKTDFNFNLIIVDNYSNDGTTEIIKEFTKRDDRVIHVTPERKDLGIGGCWNEGVHHKDCGRFAVQLDSDDLYANEKTLQKVVDTFRKEKCAMVVGSYKMINFNLEEIPPGLIDHKEWTDDNGRNNALRINGLGAPRAFYTPILREYKIPNVSYGEDYALGLTISRNYRIGRIYEPIYLCRRWEDNSDAALDIPKLNTHNTYKDRIRTYEIMARQRKNGNAE